VFIDWINYYMYCKIKLMVAIQAIYLPVLCFVFRLIMVQRNRNMSPKFLILITNIFVAFIDWINYYMYCKIKLMAAIQAIYLPVLCFVFRHYGSKKPKHVAEIFNTDYQYIFCVYWLNKLLYVLQNKTDGCYPSYIFTGTVFCI